MLARPIITPSTPYRSLYSFAFAPGRDTGYQVRGTGTCRENGPDSPDGRHAGDFWPGTRLLVETDSHQHQAHQERFETHEKDPAWRFCCRHRDQCAPGVWSEGGFGA